MAKNKRSRFSAAAPPAHEPNAAAAEPETLEASPESVVESPLESAAPRERIATAALNGAAHLSEEAPIAHAAAADARSSQEGSPTGTPGGGAPGAGGADKPAAPRRSSRFRIFIIDTGWHSVAHKVIQENLSVLEQIVREDPVYVVDHATSIEMLRAQQQLIGRDPIICVHDLHSLEKTGVKEPHGFRLHLGLVRREDQVLRALQMFARFISAHRHSDRLEADVRRSFRREGVAGAIQIMMGKDGEHLVTLR